MSLTPEQMANREKLVAALRSGEYKQGRGSLCQRKRLTKKYCCLGVAGIVVGLSVRQLGDRALLAGGEADLVGLRGRQMVLAEMNDRGTPFPVIADFIEQETREGR